MLSLKDHLTRCMSNVVVAAVLGAASLVPAAHAQMSTPGSFAVSPSGAATYTVPIQVPPGVGGLAPNLALVYNSQAGNGLLGVGWSLSGLSSITRCPRTMAQDGVRGSVNYDLNDRYCLDGQRLIAVSGAYGGNGTVYRTESDDYSRITSYAETGATNGPGSFIVKAKSGLTMEFGKTADSRIEAQGKATVIAWVLNKVKDNAGNYYTIAYTEDNANGQFYPARINYTANDAASAALASMTSVQFSYDTRSDVIQGFQMGSGSKLTKRLNAIQTCRATTAQTCTEGAQVAYYRLTYQVGTPSGRSQLAAVTNCPFSGGCLPPVTLVWLDQAAQSGTFGTPIYTLLSPESLSSSYWKPQSGEFNGDGKIDVALVHNDTYSWKVLVALSKGNGTFSAPVYTLVSSENLAASYWNPQLGDFNGDGITDVALVHNDSDSWKTLVSLSKGDGTFSAPIYTLVSPDNMSSSYWTPQLGDFNGDGITDVALVHNDTDSWKTLVALSKGDGTFSAPAYTLASPESVSSSYWRPQLGDFNGDGKTDVGLVHIDTDSWKLLSIAASGKNSNLIGGVYGILGNNVIWQYKNITDSNVFIKGGGAVYPKTNSQFPLFVVSAVEIFNGGDSYKRSSHIYGNLVSEVGTGRGSLGFQWMQTKDVSTGLVSRTYYRQDFPFIGQVDKAGRGTSEAEWFNLGLTTYKYTFKAFGPTDADYASPVTCVDDATTGRPLKSCTDSAIKPGNRYVPYTHEVLDKNSDWSADQSNVFIALPQTRTTTNQDNWGNATQIKVETLKPDGSASGYSKTTSTVFAEPDKVNWRLGRVLKSAVTSTAP
jgi:hypothetical protein